MSICEKCGKPVRKRPGQGETVCRHCIMLLLLDDPDEAEGSGDVDDYQILREIGRGGDGMVYLGYDRKVGREVAIKLVNTHGLADEKAGRRFRAEIEAIASLDHPNIIPIYANGEMDGRPFYTMKYVSGGSLTGRMAEFSTPGKAVSLLLKLALAIHHAHERGILHRDLKPSNILLDEAGEPYIGDFGLAKSSEQSLALTLTGTVMGTPSYMSPEQARGDSSHITTTSDVFSLGSILFELLSGRLAFGGENTHIILNKVIGSEVRFPREDTRHVNRDLETVCLKCLEKDPAKRYQSAFALAEDLERWQQGRPVSAHRISKAGHLVRWIRRRPLTAGAVALAAISLIVGSVVSLTLWQRSEEAREVAEENVYFSTIANAYGARTRFDFGETRRLLESTQAERRGFEWRLLDGLSRGDQAWTTDLDGEVPVEFLHEGEDGRVLLLTEDRRFNEVNVVTGEMSEAGGLPDTPGNPSTEVAEAGLRSPAFTPDGKCYHFFDGTTVMIVKREGNELIFHTVCPAGARAIWLDNHRLLQLPDHRIRVYAADLREQRLGGWLYDLRTGRMVTFAGGGLSSPFTSSPSVGRMAMTRGSNTVAVFDNPATWREEPIFSHRQGLWLTGMELSKDGRHLSVIEEGKMAHIYDLKTGRSVFEQSYPLVICSGIMPDEPVFAMAGRQSHVTLWDWQKKPGEAVFDDGREAGTPYHKDGPLGPPARLLTRSTLDGRTGFFFGHEGPVTSVLPLEDGLFLTASSDGTLRGWSKYSALHPTGRHSPLRMTHKQRDTLASANGRYLVYTRPEIWSTFVDRETGAEIDLKQSHYACGALDDGRIIVRDRDKDRFICGEFDGNNFFRRHWATPPEKDAPYQDWVVLDTSLTPDERFLAVLQPGRLAVVDLEREKSESVLSRSESDSAALGTSVDVSPDGQWVAVTGFSGELVRLYERVHLQKTHCGIVFANGAPGTGTIAVFGRDSRRLFVGQETGMVRVFAVPSFEELPLESWQAHSSEITSLAVSQDGEVIATSGGGVIAFWSAEPEPSGKRRQRLHCNTDPHDKLWMKFAGNDTLFMHTGMSGYLEVWPAPKTPAVNRKLVPGFGKKPGHSLKRKLKSLLHY